MWKKNKIKRKTAKKKKTEEEKKLEAQITKNINSL